MTVKATVINMVAVNDYEYSGSTVTLTMATKTVTMTKVTMMITVITGYGKDGGDWGDDDNADIHSCSRYFFYHALRYIPPQLSTQGCGSGSFSAGSGSGSSKSEF